LVAVILTIVIFLILISLHEFGHFIAAKLSGVSVLEFAIGMGPAIWKKQGKETLYSLRALPIGGYCKLEGEDEDSEKENAFNNQKLWKRFIVISAGAILNLILGFVVFLFVVGMEGSIATTTIKTIDTRAYIDEAGILEGDKIIKINGRKVNFYRDISYYLSDRKADETVEVSVKRNGEKLDFSVTPSLQSEKYIYDENGVSVISQVNGVEEQRYIAYSDEERENFSQYAGEEREQSRYIIGFSPVVEPVSVKNIFSESYGYTVFVVKMVYDALGDLFTGKTGIEQFSGPVGVATAVDTAVSQKGYEIPNVLLLLAMLTINLGIFNLLPLPALDGGRLVFLVIELVFRKPVPRDKEGIVHAIGMILLLLLAAVILFNDVLKLF